MDGEIVLAVFLGVVLVILAALGVGLLFIALGGLIDEMIEEETENSNINNYKKNGTL